MKTYDKHKGFTMVELMIVLVVIGIVSVIAVPSFIGRTHGQRVKVGANQVLTHLRQARSRALKYNMPYRVNFSVYDNAYFLEKRPPGSASWESVPIVGNEKEEELTPAPASGDDTTNVIFLPKNVRVNAPKLFIEFNTRGNVDLDSWPAEVFITSTAKSNAATKRHITVNLAGIPKIETE